PSNGQNSAKFDKIALLRKDASTRNIINITEIQDLLAGEGFQVLDLSSMPFSDQVAAFQNCSTVFAVLGSELTGLIYAPEQIRVLSAGPANWGDRFFYPLIQLRD